MMLNWVVTAPNLSLPNAHIKNSGINAKLMLLQCWASLKRSFEPQNRESQLIDQVYFYLDYFVHCKIDMMSLC